MNRLQKYITKLNPTRKYTPANLILMFFIFSFIGWLWEVCFYLIEQGRFVNRGYLHGPWLPIYGLGGLMILILLRRFAKKPLVLTLTSVALFGTLEYTASFLLEKIQGYRWWDYSNYRFNLNGRISLWGILLFAAAGLAEIYFLAPLLDNVLQKFDIKKRIAAALILLMIFCGDAVYAYFHPNNGDGITGGFAQVQQETFETAEKC